MDVLSYLPYIVVGLIVLIMIFKSFHYINPDEVGLVIKRIGKKLPEGKRIAENGEAGYQPDLLQPGWRFKMVFFYKVVRYPLVQIPPNSIGVVIAQVGEPLDTGAKSAVYKPELGDFSNLEAFLKGGGQRGVQRPVLPPNTTLAMHPIAFYVITNGRTFGEPLSKTTADMAKQLTAQQLSVVDITPQGDKDIVGVVTTLEGKPLPSGDIAGRLGGFADIEELEADSADVNNVIQTLLGTKNEKHDNYQDFQAFLDEGGRIGLQHDPLLYGSYLLNPFLVSVERVPMLVVQQGQAAVVKSYVGLPSTDTSGDTYKFGVIVEPGHRGIWKEPLRTGKYPLNPRIYEAEIVPTSILTLNWANATSEAHNLDARLSSIDAKSKDAFAFRIDLQVLIHVPDTKAPKVIGMVGTMQNLVNEVLQSAVGNYIRNSLQGMTAINFIEKRKEVQQQAETYVKDYLLAYDVEVKGVYIQDVVFPQDLVQVLTQREIANQEKTTYASQQEAQLARVNLEKQRGIADAQADLARSQVSIEITKNKANAAVEEAKGKATVITTEGQAEADKIEAIGKAEATATEAKGVATAAAYEAQQGAIGREQTAAVAIVQALGAGGITKLVPDTVVGEGGSGSSGLLNLLLAQMTANGGAHKASSNGVVPKDQLPAHTAD